MIATKLFKYCPVCGSQKFKQAKNHSLDCANCGFEFFANPAATAGLLLLNKDNELLVCVRRNEPGKGMLDLPGGFIDPDETAEEACRRETKEELGIKLEKFEYYASFPNHYFYKGLTVYTLDFFFLAGVERRIEVFPDDDVESAEFVPLDKLKIDRFAFQSIRKVINLLREDRCLTP